METPRPIPSTPNSGRSRPPIPGLTPMHRGTFQLLERCPFSRQSHSMAKLWDIRHTTFLSIGRDLALGLGDPKNCMTSEQNFSSQIFRMTFLGQNFPNGTYIAPGNHTVGGR